MKNNKGGNQVKLSYGLRGGELVHISTVPSGLDCDCYCAACDAKLMAKKGNEYTHHFAHYKSEDCEHAVETALHFAAKKVLEEAAQITLPELIIKDEEVSGVMCGQWSTKSGSAKVCEVHIALIESVVLEKSLKNIIPDVIAYINGIPLIIEIAVTHFVDEKKESKIHDHNIASIEIDLSDLARDEGFESIRTIVIDGIDQKKWLFHTEREKVRAELRSTLETELQIELDQIYQKEQERKRLEEAKRQLKIKQNEMTRQSIQINLDKMNSYLKEINSWQEKSVNELPNSTIWKRASSNMNVSLENLPAFLNQNVKGEHIFACDRRVWQAGLFSAFIYNTSRKYKEVYPINLERMNKWCKEHIPLNNFAFALYQSKDSMTPAEINSLQYFDCYKAIREFVRHLEQQGFIKHVYRNSYRIINDRLPIEEFSEMYPKSTFIGVNKAVVNKLSSDNQERFHERAGIHEFCSGFSRKEAEELAYSSLFHPLIDQAVSW